MQQIITYSIYVHAFFGGLGLLTGLTILFIKKGTLLHKKLGKIFSVGMLISSSVSIPICFLPKHENIFLALIGIFTIYLILSGNRAIRFKNRKPTIVDLVISYTMLTASAIMIIIGGIGLLQGDLGNVLFIFFGLLGLRLSFGDFKLYKNTNNWLRSHIGKMVGAVIASVTAFLVAGLKIQSIWAWITPSVIGTIYIYYWIAKISKNTSFSFKK